MASVSLSCLQGNILSLIGETNFKEDDLFYFYCGSITRLSDVKNSDRFRLVSRLIVIGQPLSDLSDVKFLKSLEELWVVECWLENIKGISECGNLKKAFFYSNKIKAVPNLMKLHKLEVLWLSNNAISQIESWNIPKNLQELHIADNKISSTPVCCFSESTIKSLNLSGNPIKCFKVLESLISLSTLERLVFSDPMYNSCPLCYINNYRSYTLFTLSQIVRLDHSVVTKEERIFTQEYYEDTLFYYRVQKVQSQTKYYMDLLAFIANEKAVVDCLHNDVLNLMRTQQMMIKDSDEETFKQACSVDYKLKKDNILSDASKYMSMIECERHFVNLRYQVELDKIEFELRNLGKYVFKHYEMNSMLGTICQKLLNEFTCCYMRRDLHIKSIELFKVSHIYNSDCPQFNNMDDSLKFFLLVSPLSITDLRQWSFSKLDQFLIESQQNESMLLTVTNCIYSGDNSLIHDNIPECCSNPRVALVVYTSNANNLVKSTLLTCHGGAHSHSRTVAKPCSKHVIRACDIVPSFIIEYNYKQDVKNANDNLFDKTKFLASNVSSVQRRSDLFPLPGNGLQEDGVDNDDSSCNAGVVATEHMTVSELKRNQSKQYRFSGISLSSMVKTDDWKILTELNLSDSKITSFNEDQSAVQMVNVTSLDLSYNYLTSLEYLASMFPNARTVNVSFNNISTVSFCEVMSSLEAFDVSWNRINRLVILLMQLKSNAPAIRNLDSRFNPTADVHDNRHAVQFARKYLPELINFNGAVIRKPVEFNMVTDLIDKLKQASCRRVLSNSLTLNWMSQCCVTKDNHMIGMEPHIGYDQTGKLVCIMANGVLNCHSVWSSVAGSDNVRFIDLSSTALDRTCYLEPLKQIEEINVSDNLLRCLGSAFSEMINLVKLDLSYNYLTSVRDMTDTQLPSLKVLNLSYNLLTLLNGVEHCVKIQELYVSHNYLANMDSIKPLKNLHQLRAVAFDYNTVQDDQPVRFFLIYHLHQLEFINGIRIDEEEEALANEEYVGVIDTDYLLRDFSGVQLPHLTELTLSKCSVKEIILDESCLVNLKVLDLEYNNVTCLEGIAVLPVLETLNLGFNKIISFSEKRGETGKETPIIQIENKVNNSTAVCKDEKEKLFRQLRILALHSNRISSLVPLELSLFPKLETLLLNDNELSSLSGLQGVHNLRNLILDKNKISGVAHEEFQDVSPTLNELYLENNQLKNIKFIKKCVNLKKLFLAQNRIQDLHELRHLENLGLHELTLWGNAITRNFNYYTAVVECLPDLKRFDGVQLQNFDQEKVTKKKREASSGDSNTNNCNE